MKEFVKDYVDLCKHSNQWMKKHWKGYTLLCVLTVGGEFAYFYRNEIKDKFNELKKKSQVEES